MIETEISPVNKALIKMYNARAEAMYGPLRSYVYRHLRCRCPKEPVRWQYCALPARALLEIEVCIHRDVIVMSLYFIQVFSVSTDPCTKF